MELYNTYVIVKTFILGSLIPMKPYIYLTTVHLCVHVCPNIFVNLFVFAILLLHKVELLYTKFQVLTYKIEGLLHGNLKLS